MISAILIVGARDIAPPIFDPVGSAALPIACAIALSLLGAGVLMQTWLKPEKAQHDSNSKTNPTRLATLGLLALIIIYLLAMNNGVRFSYATTGFVAVGIPVICQRLRIVPFAAIIAVVLGFGAEWVFTSLFFVDLPGTR